MNICIDEIINQFLVGKKLRLYLVEAEYGFTAKRGGHVRKTLETKMLNNCIGNKRSENIKVLSTDICDYVIRGCSITQDYDYYGIEIQLQDFQNVNKSYNGYNDCIDVDFYTELEIVD